MPGAASRPSHMQYWRHAVRASRQFPPEAPRTNSGTTRVQQNTYSDRSGNQEGMRDATPMR